MRLCVVWSLIIILSCLSFTASFPAHSALSESLFETQHYECRKSGLLMAQPEEHYLDHQRAPLKVYLGRSLFLIMDLISKSSLLCLKSPPYPLRPDLSNEADSIRVSRKPVSPDFKPSPKDLKPFKSGSRADASDKPNPKRLKPNIWKNPIKTHRYQLPDELLLKLNPRSNFALLMTDFLVAIQPPFLQNPAQQHEDEESHPVSTPVSLHIYFTQNEGQAAHFFLAETSIEDQIPYQQSHPEHAGRPLVTGTVESACLRPTLCPLKPREMQN